jgi:hypothetical protein
LHAIASLDRYLDELPGELDRGQSLLLKRDPWFCIFIADRCHKSGDDIRAIEWARYGVDASIGFPEAYTTLFTLLRDSGDLAGAEDRPLCTCSTAFDCDFLRGMKDLATRLGELEAAAHWAQRLERELVVPRDFADIIKARSGNPLGFRELWGRSTPRRSGIDSAGFSPGFSTLLQRTNGLDRSRRSTHHHPTLP